MTATFTTLDHLFAEIRKHPKDKAPKMALADLLREMEDDRTADAVLWAMKRRKWTSHNVYREDPLPIWWGVIPTDSLLNADAYHNYLRWYGEEIRWVQEFATEIEAFEWLGEAIENGWVK